MNKSNFPFTYFIFDKNFIENTEPLEELIRERNSYLKNDNKSVNFWSISINRLKKEKFSELVTRLGLEKNSSGIKKFCENYIILSTIDEKFSDWLSLKLPDVLEINSQQDFFAILEKNIVIYNGYKFTPSDSLNEKLYTNPATETYFKAWEHMY